jgi:hypothetical protein
MCSSIAEKQGLRKEDAKDMPPDHLFRSSNLVRAPPFLQYLAKALYLGELKATAECLWSTRSLRESEALNIHDLKIARIKDKKFIGTVKIQA